MNARRGRKDSGCCKPDRAEEAAGRALGVGVVEQLNSLVTSFILVFHEILIMKGIGDLADSRGVQTPCKAVGADRKRQSTRLMAGEAEAMSRASA